jgi:hypothetical protein
MIDKRHPQIEELKTPARELTPEEAEAAEGGIIAILIDAGLTAPRAPGSNLAVTNDGDGVIRY